MAAAGNQTTVLTASGEVAPSSVYSERYIAQNRSGPIFWGPSVFFYATKLVGSAHEQNNCLDDPNPLIKYGLCDRVVRIHGDT